LRSKTHLLAVVLVITLLVAIGQSLCSADQTAGSYLVGTVQGAYSNRRGTYEVTIYYPALKSGANTQPNKASAPYAAVVFSPGYGSSYTKHTYTWIANHLTSRGFIVAIFTAPNTLSIDLGEWSDGISDGITYLQEVSTSGSSIVKGMVDMNRIGAMGHSMGGAAAIRALFSRFIRVQERARSSKVVEGSRPDPGR